MGDILNETINQLIETNIVDDIENYNDAVDLICSNCKTVTRFYYVDIKPYIDFYTEDFLYEDEVECPICKSKELTLDKLGFGFKSPDGRKFEIIKKGDNVNE